TRPGDECFPERPASPETSNDPCWSGKIVERCPNGIPSKPGSRYTRSWARRPEWGPEWGKDRSLPAQHRRTTGAMGRQAGALPITFFAIGYRFVVKKPAVSKSCPYPCSIFD